MARKKRDTPAPFDGAALDALLGERKTLEEVDQLFLAMKKALMERVLKGELTAHLGYGPAEAKPADQPNQRNGSTPKTVHTPEGSVTVAIPRDRAGTFAPQLIPKHVRRLPRFDENVVSLYARGMSVREIQEHLEELYQVAVSPSVISAVTDEVLEEVAQWQQRPLDRCYPVMILDALRVKIRDEGLVRAKAVYVALGITTLGEKEVLGLWVEQTEGARFWHRVMTELRSRGVEDILVALIDGLTGFPEAIGAVFPAAQVHTCVVHLVRRSLAFVSYQDRKPIAAELRAIYRAPTVVEATAALDAFATGRWGVKYPLIAPLWQRAWEAITPAFAYPPAIRRLLNTTNAIESLHMQLRKIVKTRGSFPTDEAATKLLYLALRNVQKRWKRAPVEWAAALPHFVVLFPGRFTPGA